MLRRLPAAAVAAPFVILFALSRPTLDPAAGALCPGGATPPTAAVDATSATPAPAAGTPAAGAGLVVTLLPGRDRAGPNDLTVLVRDAACAAVAGAGVVVQTRSLEMDHGVRTTGATAAEPGQYVAAGIPMGMAGDWEVMVSVVRGEDPPAVFVFVLTLHGPR